MNLHEYQSKELLKKFDLPIPRGKIFINNLNKFGDKITELGPGPWAIKSQIHAGGRGAGYFNGGFILIIIFSLNRVIHEIIFIIPI